MDSADSSHSSPPSAPASGATWPSQRATYIDLFDKLLDTVLFLDFESQQITDANPAAERLLGKNREALTGRLLTEWIVDSDHAGFAQAIRIAKRSFYPRRALFELRPMGDDGSRVYVESVVCTLRLADGQDVIQILGKDITRQVEAEKQAQAYLAHVTQLNAKLEALAVTDEKTQLANYRSFERQLHIAHQSALESGKSYALIFCDLDHFKKYNDRNGHPEGDALLKQLSQILQRACRPNDLPARFGGEEFVVLCPDTPHDGALKFAERLRASIEAYPFAHAVSQPLGKVTVSIGVANYPDHGQDAAAVLKAADLAVYASKARGRNCVSSAQDNEVASPTAESA